VAKRRSLESNLNNVLIVGASGLIGGRLATEFMTQGLQVYAINRNLLRDVPPGIAEIESLDLKNRKRLGQLLSVCDAVFYCAGSSAEICAKYPAKAITENSLKAFEFSKLCAASKVSSFYYISTAHVYNSPLSGIINEDTATQNQHPYAYSRLIAEKLISSFCSSVDMSFKSIRLSNSFGVPHSKNVNCWSLFVNQQCLNIIQNQKITINSSPNTLRDFIPLNLVCQQISNLLHLKIPQTIVNLGANRTSSLMRMSNEIARVYRKNWNRSVNIQYDLEQVHVVSDFQYNSKILQKINDRKFEEEMNLEIKSLIEFCSAEFSEK
jgi:UDP-glucose 4-epimerase